MCSLECRQTDEKTGQVIHDGKYEQKFAPTPTSRLRRIVVTENVSLPIAQEIRASSYLEVSSSSAAITSPCFDQVFSFEVR
jgi:hypothetical protein